jgi:hypothetical protein
MLPVVLCSGLQAQGVEGELQEVAERLAAAQRAQLDLISPRNYERASERLADARERHANGSRVEDVLSRLVDARRYLEEAERLRADGERLLGPALRTRATALDEAAPQWVPGAWRNAQETLLDAGRRLESSDPDEAALLAERAAGLFAEPNGKRFVSPVWAMRGLPETGPPERGPPTWRPRRSVRPSSG